MIFMSCNYTDVGNNELFFFFIPDPEGLSQLSLLVSESFQLRQSESESSYRNMFPLSKHHRQNNTNILGFVPGSLLIQIISIFQRKMSMNLWVCVYVCLCVEGVKPRQMSLTGDTVN